jgi:hypothetical protein
MVDIRTDTKVAIDIQDLASEVILDSLLDSGGEVFRTSRQRKAILIGQAAISELKQRFSLRLEDGPDGVNILKG